MFLSAQHYKLLTNVFSPASSIFKTYDYLCAKMKEHFVPEKVEIVEVHRFYRCKQKNMETVQDILVNLRQLAKDLRLRRWSWLRFEESTSRHIRIGPSQVPSRPTYPVPASLDQKSNPWTSIGHGLKYGDRCPTHQATETTRNTDRRRWSQLRQDRCPEEEEGPSVSAVAIQSIWSCMPACGQDLFVVQQERVPVIRLLEQTRR